MCGVCEMAKDFRVKTRELFAEHFPGARLHEGVPAAVEHALRDRYGEKAHDIAFHLSDWREDAAFLVALALAPEQFTQEDISEGVIACMIHIPNHVAAAATLGDCDMRDIFNVGASIKPPL